MPYRDAVAALEIKLRGLRDARRELDASIRETRRELRHHRRQPEHRSWTDVAIALAVLAVVGLATYFMLAPMWSMTCSRVDTARTTVRTIKGAASLYVGRGGDCPTMADLIDRGIIDEDQATTDSWDRPFRIICVNGHVGVSSAGPDEMHGTEDDINSWERPE